MSDDALHAMTRVAWSYLRRVWSHPEGRVSMLDPDCVVIATDHSAFDYERILEHSRLVVDTRNATKGLPKVSYLVKL